jgi:dihydrofolate synthase/folylpolyglutamate synthase
VTGAEGDALGVIRRRARRLGVRLHEVVPPPLLDWDRDAIHVNLPGLGPTRVGLRGRHQAVNAAVALAILDALTEAGIADVPDEARRRGFAEARWPGRLELVEGRRPGGEPVEVLLDGAHNAAGAAALAQALDDLRPFLAGGGDAVPPPLTLVWGSMADKDLDGMVGALARSHALEGVRVACTRVDEARATDPAVLAAAWRRACPTAAITIDPDPAAALERAIAAAPGPVVVAGSLYLVGLARGRLVDDPLLRDPVPGEP